MILNCSNCQWIGDENDTIPAQDIELRHTIGDIYSDCECPECGCLCFPPDSISLTSNATKMLVALKTILPMIEQWQGRDTEWHLVNDAITRAEQKGETQ